MEQHLGPVAEVQRTGRVVVDEREDGAAEHPLRVRRPRPADNQRTARLIAETIALKEAVVMDGSMPTPQRTWPFTSAST